MKKYKELCLSSLKERYDFNRSLEREVFGLIDNQNKTPVAEMKYGKKYTLAYNGCEVIAVYNALNIIGKYTSLSEIIYEFEINKAMSFSLNFLKTHPTKLKILPYLLLIFSKIRVNFKSGVYGTNPIKIGDYLATHNCKYAFCETLNELEHSVKIGGVYIISAWNEKKLGSAIHTFCISADKSGLLHTYNGYNDNRIYKSFKEIITEKGAEFICGYALE